MVNGGGGEDVGASLAVARMNIQHPTSEHRILNE
jgi:hypothetical protein